MGRARGPPGGDVPLAIVDRETGAVVGAPFEGQRNTSDFAISPDGEMVLCTNQPKPTLTAIRVRDGATREIELKPPIFGGYVSYADSKSIVLAGALDDVSVLARSDLDGHVTILARSPQELYGLRVAADGRSIVLIERVVDGDVWLVQPR